jgi:adenylate cyclase
VRVNYAGPRAERATSAAAVLQTAGVSPALGEKLSGRIVIVGSSAQALFDIRATPLDAQAPGVSIHAEVIEQVAAGLYLQRPDWARGLEVAAIGIVGLLLTLALLTERPVLGLLTAALLSLISILGAACAFANAGLLLNPIFPVLTSVFIFLPGASIGFLVKERARRAVRSRFAYFLPSDVVDEIADDPNASLTPTGADRELTIFFADMRGFTSATETMSPSDVVRYVNAFLSAVSDALVASGATIDKFMGDAVMAFWNAPLENAAHRADALRAIGRVEAAVREANQRLPEQGLPGIDIAIGVNTGLASVGLMGSKDRLSYTCIGDSVTLAARLEGLTRRYNVGNCVAGATLRDLPEGIEAIELDLIAVKGRATAETVFTVAPASDETAAASAQIAAARERYLARDWDGAEAAFHALAEGRLNGRSLSTLAQEYLGRIAEFRATPPPADWIGGAVATEKR